YQDLKASALDVKLLLQVHDELIFEVAETDTAQAAHIIKNAMENVVHLSVPLIAEVGIADNWKEAH
ncbi:MAG: DNA polymerase, partial [Alphaproteobacteria bacterium]